MFLQLLQHLKEDIFLSYSKEVYFKIVGIKERPDGSLYFLLPLIKNIP